MMNRIIYSLLFLLHSVFLHAQITYPRDATDVSVVDSGYIKVFYAFNATNIEDSETYDDLHLLEIGMKYSKFYSFFTSNSDSLVTDWKRKNPNSSASPITLGPRGKSRKWWSEYSASEYFKYFTDNTLTEYCRMPHTLRKVNSFYLEDIPKINWEIHNDTMRVADYICQKATCHFRGRDYIAWFTPDIPIDNGPWKLGGLPGLILKASDRDDKYCFECIKIELWKYPIKKHNEYNSYNKENREKILKLQKDMNEDFYKVANLVPAFGSKRPEKKVYDPLELE